MVIKEVLLPGIGVRYEFACRSGDRIGIIARRGGDVEVVCDARDDPDQARPLLRLTQRLSPVRVSWALLLQVGGLLVAPAVLGGLARGFALSPRAVGRGRSPGWQSR